MVLYSGAKLEADPDSTIAIGIVLKLSHISIAPDNSNTI